MPPFFTRLQDSDLADRLPKCVTVHTHKVVRAEGIGKRFGRAWLFRGLSFELAAGEGLAILGHNGAGKSTLIRILAGLIQPGEGQVHLGVDHPRHDLALASLEQSLYPNLTPSEHLELAGDLRVCPARTNELLIKVGLTEGAKKPAAQLSSGMRSRLRLALAIQPNPKILLLDEPGAALDEDGKCLVEKLCSEQRERGILIIATNDPAERRFASRELNL